MGKSYSLDLRERIIADIEGGSSRRSVAHRRSLEPFGVEDEPLFVALILSDVPQATPSSQV